MKLIKNIGLLVFLMLIMVACVEKTPDYGNFPTKDVDFTYNVSGGQFELDFYVVSTIQFANVSSKSGAASWDFGDGNVSTETNPAHKYDKAGLYNVKLTIDGVGSRTYPILIYDVVPVLAVEKQSSDIVVINDVTVEMSIFLPNPENLKCEFTWTFPEGTTNDAGEVLTEWKGYSHEDGSIDYPGKLKFKHIGSQKIEINTIFDLGGEDQRVLESAYVNVQVGCSYPCKTLYFAEVDGNIKAVKLVDTSKLPEGTKVGTFDMGVKSGSMPTQLIYKNVDGQDFIYIIDCGKQYTYTNDENSVNGDGKITVMTTDGSMTNVVVTNVGKQAFNDPFQGCADKEFLYYTDRNTGIRKIKLTARGEVEQSHFKTEIGYMVTNQQLAYYGKGISYGAIHSDLAVDSKGMFYWGKNYSGNGIYRFMPIHIGDLAAPLYPVLLPGSNPRSIAIDEINKKMYVWMIKGIPGAGLCEFALPDYDKGLDAKAYSSYVAMDSDPINNTADEGIYVSQLAIDSENGKVYFGFNRASTENRYITGLKVYDPTTKKVTNLNDNNDKIYGVVICDTPSKLFNPEKPVVPTK